MTPVDATTRPLRAVLDEVTARLAAGATLIEVRALDPDRGAGLYAGERVVVDGVAYVHRSLRTWIELAERLGLHLARPQASDGPAVMLAFSPLGELADDGARGPEKYGAGSEHARRSKLEDPRFVVDVREAFARMTLAAPRVLALGCNSGDELELVLERWPDARITGIDHSASAIAVAQRRFPAATFVVGGFTELPVSDLVVCIDTLQSPGVDDRALVRTLVLECLAPGGCLLLGFPNARYRGGELEYGARSVNLTEPELGLLVKDVGHYRRYLAQHRLRVFVTGKQQVLITAVPAS